LRGGPVLRCPAARSHHAYEFGRNRGKHYHMERGRLLVLAANYDGRTLLALLPGLVATELGLLAVSAVQGWLPQKLRSLGSVARSLPAARRQRRLVQGGRPGADPAPPAHLETPLAPQFAAAAAAPTRAPP